MPRDLGYPDESDIKPYRVRGCSMEGKYYDGDIVWVYTRYRKIDLNRFGIFHVEGCIYIKKMGYDKLISVNPDYDDISLNKEMDEDDWYVIGAVIDCMSKEEFEEILNIQWAK